MCLTAAIALGWGSWHLHKSRTVQLFGELVSSVATQDSVIALTFDDGPDSWYRTADDMTRHVLERVEPGAIILLHVELPERRAERAALVQIIEGLQERGYAFVTVSDLIARGSR